MHCLYLVPDTIAIGNLEILLELSGHAQNPVSVTPSPVIVLDAERIEQDMKTQVNDSHLEVN